MKRRDTPYPGCNGKYEVKHRGERSCGDSCVIAVYQVWKKWEGAGSSETGAVGCGSGVGILTQRAQGSGRRIESGEIEGQCA